MAYCVKPEEAVARGLKRIAREEASHAMRELTGAGDRHEAIHEARKSIKKLRALLRLIEPQLGNVARNEGRRLRDLGRTLSVLRDTAAMVETFDQLAEAHPAEMGLNRFAAVRRELVNARDLAIAASGEAGLASAAAAEFRKLLPSINLWRLRGEGFPVVAEGFEAAYDAGRRAFRRAQKDPSSGNCHELRKRAKDHWYHVRMLGPLWPRSSEAYERAIRDVQEALGDANNAAVFLSRLHKNDPGPLRDIAIHWRDRLRSRALEGAARVYTAKSPPVAVAETLP